MPAYPPFLLRQTNFRQAESAGQAISTANMDGEADDSFAVVNELNRRLRLITDVSGKLTNVAAQISQALVGSQQFTTVGGELTFTTTIAWDSFSVANVLVIANGAIVSQSLYTVTNVGGFLRVTLTAAATAGFVLVAAFSTGAGIQTRLADTTSGANGANMVGLQDAAAKFVSTTVEGALAELATSLNTLITNLGVTGDLWTRQGVSLSGGFANAPWNLGAQRITNLANAVNAQDAATLAQVLALTQSIQDLLVLFIRADGGVPFGANQSIGGFKLTNLGAPTAGGDAANQTYVDAADAVVRAASLAVDGIKTTDARGRVTGPISMEELATATADAVQNATTVVQTIFGVAKPAANDQVANKLYVDEAIAAATTSDSRRSPYSRRTYSKTLAAIAGFDGAITNIAAGGAFMATSFTITVAQAPPVHTYLFTSGNVDISAALTLAANQDLEINATGNVTINADITARNIRIFASGTITIAAAATLTASDVHAGVVALEGASTLTSAGNINAALIFAYFAGNMTVTAGTWRASLQHGCYGAWNFVAGRTAWYTRLGYVVSTQPAVGSRAATAGRWGEHVGALDDRAILAEATLGTAPAPQVKQALPDYMSPHAGLGGEGHFGGVGYGYGGSGPRGGGGQLGAPVLPLGNMRLWAVPAAPGGGGGTGSQAVSNAASGGGGGGVILLFTLGNLVLTGTAVFNANGTDGSQNIPAAAVEAGGGGGGGFVKMSARGTITDGTASAAGGNNPGGPSGQGGGSGGVVVAVATAFAGVQAFTVPSANPATANPGATLAQVLTVTQWDEARLNGYLER